MPVIPPAPKFAHTPMSPSVADLMDQEIHGMTREHLIDLLSQIPPRFLERRVKRRLMYFDENTLRRLLFLCRRCERNLAQMHPHRLDRADLLMTANSQTSP